MLCCSLLTTPPALAGIPSRQAILFRPVLRRITMKTTLIERLSYIEEKRRSFI